MKSCPNCNELLGDSADKCFNCHYDFRLKRVISQRELVEKREREKVIIEEKTRQASENAEKVKQFSAGISDFLGVNSTSYEDKLAEAKEVALEKLRSKAISMISNGLIGIDFDISTIGDNMIIVSANGTAVVAEKI